MVNVLSGKEIVVSGEMLSAFSETILNKLSYTTFAMWSMKF